MRILIADDDQICREVLAMHLSLLGTCETAGSGRNVITCITRAWEENQPFGLLFLDILMPEGDGQEVLHQIRTLEERRNIGGLQQLKVVMTTSLGDRRQVMTAFRGQAQAYLIKPVDTTKLRKVLKDLGVLGTMV